MSSQLGQVIAQLCGLRMAFDAAMHLRAAVPIHAPQVNLLMRRVFSFQHCILLSIAAGSLRLAGKS